MTGKSLLIFYVSCRGLICSLSYVQKNKKTKKQKNKKTKKQKNKKTKKKKKKKKKKTKKEA